MSDLSPFSTSNIVWQSVSLTDDVNINLEYDIQQGLLNIFVKNFGDNNKLPYHINVLSNQSKFQQDSLEQMICYEVSTTYSYDIDDDEHENLDLSPIMITSSSSSSSCFDEQTLDNDDGYSTHSQDDVDQQQLSLVIPSPKCLRPSFSSHRYHDSEQYVLSIRRLIEQLTWLSPFKKTIQQMMMMNHLFI